MGESKRKSRNRAAVLAREARCIYCAEFPDSLEHMPPVWFFRERSRPSGLEFASCKRCNNGTRAADFVAGWLARIRPFHGDRSDPLFKEAFDRNQTLDQLAPGLRSELFDKSNYQEILVRGPHGILEPVVRIEANGPILATLLVTFGAKLGMALYREHVGANVSMDGAVYVQPYLNGGLSQDQADALLEMLPNHNTLTQGKIQVGDQFFYRFNTDRKSLFAALVAVHEDLHFFVAATSDDAKYGKALADLTICRVAPGGLLAIPPLIRSYLVTCGD